MIRGSPPPFLPLELKKKVRDFEAACASAVLCVRRVVCDLIVDPTRQDFFLRLLRG